MYCITVCGGVQGKLIGLHPRSLSSAGLGLALVQSCWIMFVALGVNHAFSPVQIMGLVFITVPILKMWPFSVLVLVPLVLTAALLTVSLALAMCCEVKLMLLNKVLSDIIDHAVTPIGHQCPSQ